MRLVLALVVCAGCGIGFQRVLDTTEIPAGGCSQVTLGPEESCRHSAHDYSIGTTVGHDKATTAWFRWPLFDTGIDERVMHHGTLSYRSVAGAIGTHLRPMLMAPEIQRYFDPVVNLGFDLGVVRKDSQFAGRGDGYIEAAIDLYAPDIGAMRYLETGVPGVRIGVRYTAYVQGWDSDTTVEVGLIWRWGDPIDLYRHWTWQRTGD